MHPYDYFGRSSWQPNPGDADLLPKPDKLYPSKQRMPYGADERGGATAGELHPEGPGPLPEGFLTAPDVERLPWRRRRGDEWTTPALRAVVLAWMKQLFRDLREPARLVSWDITEKATANMASIRLDPSAQYLRIGLTQRVKCGTRRIELGVSFPFHERAGAPLFAKLAIARMALEAQLTIL